MRITVERMEFNEAGECINSKETTPPELRHMIPMFKKHSRQEHACKVAYAEESKLHIPNSLLKFEFFFDLEVL